MAYEVSPEDESDFRQWLAEKAARQPVPATPWPRTEPGPEPAAPEPVPVPVRTLEPEPESSPEPARPAYAAGPVAHQAVAGAGGDQPQVLDDTEVYPARVDHLARAHHAGGHAGHGTAISN
jgi:hypothetical protein